MFSNPSMAEWFNALIPTILTVGIIIGVSTLVALGVIKMLGSGEESQEERAKVTTPTIPEKRRTAA